MGVIRPGDVVFEGLYIEGPMLPELASLGWLAHPWFHDAIHAAPPQPIDPARAWDLVHDLRVRHPGVAIEPLWEIGLAPGPTEPVPEAVRAPPADRRWHIAQVAAEAAWQLEPKPGGSRRGAGVVIGHLDTGYREHPDLEALWTPALGWDVYGNDPDAHDDLDVGLLLFPGHGTSTASIIGSRGVASRVLGTAPACTAIPFRISTSVVHLSMTHMTDGIRRAVAAGAHVISLSAGGLHSRALHHAVRDAVAAGVVVVAAAGNYTIVVVWPARYAEVISCGATNVDRDVWMFSNGGLDVDVMAPGEDVWVLRPGDVDHVVEIDHRSGTSFATACVAGAVANWLAFHGRDALIARYGRANLAAVAKQLIRDTRGDGQILDIEALLRAELPSPSAFAALESVQPLAPPTDEAEFHAFVARQVPPRPRPL